MHAAESRTARASERTTGVGDGTPVNLKLPDKVKATFQLPRGDLEQLQVMAGDDAVSVTEALRRAIRTEAMLRKQIAEGFRMILVSEDGKTQRELVRW